MTNYAIVSKKMRTLLMRTSRESRDGWIGEKLNEAEHIAWNACEIITRFARKVNLHRHTLSQVEFQRRLHYIVEKVAWIRLHGPWLR
jgi:hypothetical protein